MWYGILGFCLTATFTVLFGITVGTGLMWLGLIIAFPGMYLVQRIFWYHEIGVLIDMMIVHVIGLSVAACGFVVLVVQVFHITVTATI